MNIFPFKKDKSSDSLDVGFYPSRSIRTNEHIVNMLVLMASVCAVAVGIGFYCLLNVLGWV